MRESVREKFASVALRLYHGGHWLSGHMDGVAPSVASVVPAVAMKN